MTRRPIRSTSARAVLALAAGLIAIAPTPSLARMPEAGPMPSAMPRILRLVSATGTTKPAGAALDVRRGTNPALDAESRRLDRLIRTSICIRC